MIQSTHFSTPHKALVKWSWVPFERPIKAMHDCYELFMISEYWFGLFWPLLRSFYSTRFGPKTWVKKHRSYLGLDFLALSKQRPVVSSACIICLYDPHIKRKLLECWCWCHAPKCAAGRYIASVIVLKSFKNSPHFFLESLTLFQYFT